MRGKEVDSCPVGKAVSTALPSTAELLVRSRGRTTRRTAVISLVQGSLDVITSGMSMAHCQCMSALCAGRNPVLRADSRVDKILPGGCISRLKRVLFELLPTNSVAKTPGCGAVRVVRRTRRCREKFCANVAKCFSKEGLSDTIVVHFVRRRGKRVFFGDKKKVAYGDSLRGRCGRVGRGICIPVC